MSARAESELVELKPKVEVSPGFSVDKAVEKCRTLSRESALETLVGVQIYPHVFVPYTAGVEEQALLPINYIKQLNGNSKCKRCGKEIKEYGWQPHNAWHRKRAKWQLGQKHIDTY